MHNGDIQYTPEEMRVDIETLKTNFELFEEGRDYEMAMDLVGKLESEMISQDVKNACESLSADDIIDMGNKLVAEIDAVKELTPP